MGDRPKVFIVTTGGTIFQRESAGRMEIALSVQDLAGCLEPTADLEFHEVERRAGAEMTFQTLLEVRDLIVAKRDETDGTVLITGTDSMEEVAFALDSMLPPGAPVAITGAMKPPDVLGYDGVANLNDAIKVVCSTAARNLGVLVVMNDSIHPARYVRKNDSALIGSFVSHPGPIGQIRRGEPLFYYGALPEMPRFVDVDEKRLRDVAVMIWPMTMSPHLPDAALECLDGLVISGMGTGSVASEIVRRLSPRWTERMPIVLSSRCPVGLSYDDFYYRGSREKYESLGFRILGFEDLNPLQARIKLSLEIASK